MKILILTETQFGLFCREWIFEVGDTWCENKRIGKVRQENRGLKLEGDPEPDPDPGDPEHNIWYLTEGLWRTEAESWRTEVGEAEEGVHRNVCDPENPAKAPIG